MSKQNSGGFDQAKAASPKAIPPKFNGNSQSNKNKGAFPPPGEHAGNVRYCFHCGKPDHVMKSCVLWPQKQAVKPANIKRVGVLSENSIISHANEPLAHHGAVSGTITEVIGMTGSDDVGVFDVRQHEVTSGHSVNTGEATTLTDGPVFINESASTEVIDDSSASSGSGAASDATSSCVSRVAGGSAVIGDDVISEARRSDQLIHTCISTTMSANELSRLKYVSVRVANDDTKENSFLCFV